MATHRHEGNHKAGLVTYSNRREGNGFMSSTAELLDDYIRVINAKDTENTRLLRENELLQLELRKKDDKFQSKLMNFRAELERLQAAASGQSQKHAEESETRTRLVRENEALKSDMLSLRDALRRSEDQLQSLTKVSSKAQRHESHAREKLESEFRHVRANLEERLFEALQRCAQLESTAAVGGSKATDAEKEVTRWKIEAQRLQHENSEQHFAIKELKRRCREMIPRDLAEKEAQQLEDRFRSQLNATETECGRLRDLCREESLRAQRLESLLLETRKRVEDGEHELALSRRQFEELTAAYTQMKLHSTGTLEDLRKDAAAESRALREQLEKERLARIALDGEVISTKQRLADMSSLASQQSSKAAQELQRLEEDNAGLRRRSQDLQSEVETLKRQLQLESDAVRLLQAKSAAARSETDTEISKLRSQLIHTEDVVGNRESELSKLQTSLNEARSAATELQAELTAERTACMKREQEIRAKQLQIEELTQSAEATRRLMSESHDDQLRAARLQIEEERAARQRDVHRLTTSYASQLRDSEERFTAAERNVTELRSEISTLREEIAIRTEKERSLLCSQTTSDQRITDVQLTLSEREASLQTLRRNYEQVCAALKERDAELETTNRLLSQEREATRVASSKIAALQDTVRVRDADLLHERQHVSQLEQSAMKTSAELQRELTSQRDTIQQLGNDLSTSQQRCAMLEAELRRSERQHNDDAAALQREVVAPLHAKVETLQAQIQRLQREVSDRDDRLQEQKRESAKLNETILFVQGELTSKEKKVGQLTEDLEACQSQLVAFRRTQQQLSSSLEDTRRVQSEAMTLSERMKSIELIIETKTREISALQDREIDLVSEVSKYRSEVVTLKERYANLESLKAISDQSVTEMQQRERDLLEKLEELRTAQAMMQVCFDKQQEQLELGRKLRIAAGAGSGAPSPTSASAHHTSLRAAANGDDSVPFRLQF